MMKRAVTACIAAAAFIGASHAGAQAVCRAYEYAELRDMRQDKLKEMWCEYRRGMSELVHLSLANLKAGRRAASDRDLADANQCAQELERIERVLDAKFNAKKPTCPPGQQ